MAALTVPVLHRISSTPRNLTTSVSVASNLSTKDPSGMQLRHEDHFELPSFEPKGRDERVLVGCDMEPAHPPLAPAAAQFRCMSIPPKSSDLILQVSSCIFSLSGATMPYAVDTDYKGRRRPTRAFRPIPACFDSTLARFEEGNCLGTQSPREVEKQSRRLWNELPPFSLSLPPLSRRDRQHVLGEACIGEVLTQATLFSNAGRPRTMIAGLHLSG